MSEFQQVAVVGSGLMGSGIAEVFARSGLAVVVLEVDEQASTAGRDRIERSLDKGVKAEKLTSDARDVLENLTFSTDIEALADRQLVIEAIVEKEDMKSDLFRALDRVVNEHAILASNTSSIPIVRLAMTTRRPESVIGLHFFYPATVMSLVEVIPSLLTSDETLRRTEDFATNVIDKHVVRCRDQAGFVVNALLVPYLLRAIKMFEAGTASADDIDDGMRLGCAHPVGPLRLSDFVGLDTLKSVADVLYDETKDPSCAPPALLLRMVEAGKLGRKSGEGFFSYAAS